MAAFAPLPSLADPPAPPPSCADEAASVELATPGEREYWFDTAGHVVDARGVPWVGIMHSTAVSLLGLESGCFTGGVLDGPYDDSSVFECNETHCPIEGCPTPCLAYHSTECIASQSAGAQTIEGVLCAHYGDGISRELESGELVIRRAHLRDLNDDAIEDDYGLASTRVFDSLIDGVHVAFGDRQRSSQDNDATGTEWEVRDSLIRARPNQNPYKRRPGHGGFWKGDPVPTHQHRYRLTSNVFVAQGLKQSGVLFPVLGYVDECAGNVLLWAGPITGSGGWDEALLDGSDLSDALTDGERLTALNAAFPGCFSVVVKDEAQTEQEFLDSSLPELGGASWNQLVATWIGPNTGPSVVITSPGDGTILPPGVNLDFVVSAGDAQDGNLSAQVAWSSDLSGSLGNGATLSFTNLPLGTHLITASVVDSEEMAASASLTVTVAVATTSSGFACGIGPELALLIPLLVRLRGRRLPD